MERVQVTYTGRVQGVGFRATVADLAKQFPVSGCVRNHTDGSVRLLAEGEPAELVGFLEAIQKRLARYIVDCQDRWNPLESPEFSSFSIAPTTDL